MPRLAAGVASDWEEDEWMVRFKTYISQFGIVMYSICWMIKLRGMFWSTSPAPTPTSKVFLQGVWSSVSLHTTSLANLIRHNWRTWTWERQKPGQKRRRGGRKQRWWRTGMEQWQDVDDYGESHTRFSWFGGKNLMLWMAKHCLLASFCVVFYDFAKSYIIILLFHFARCPWDIYIQLNYCRKMRV